MQCDANVHVNVIRCKARQYTAMGCVCVATVLVLVVGWAGPGESSSLLSS